MKRSAFRLDPVLRVRQREERTAALASAAAAVRAGEAAHAADDLDLAVDASGVPALVDGAGFAVAMLRTRTMAADASVARASARSQAEQAEVSRAEWTRAAQRAKALERLSDRHAAAQRRAEDRAEELVVDDLVTGRFGGRRQLETGDAQ